MRHSEQLNEIAPALVKAQATILPAVKDKQNPQFKGSKYADLTAVWEACRKAITDAGLSALQEVIAAEDGIAITTRLQHQSGQWMEFGPTPIPVNKKDAQGTGSAISYGKRYALSAALGVVADDDDDGNAAAKSAPKRERAESEPPAGSARGVAVAAFQELDPIARESLERRAQAIQEVYGRDGIVVAVDELHAMKLDNDQKLAIWSLFDSEFRSSIKREEQRRAQLKEAA